MRIPSRIFGVKWEPVALMAGLLLVALAIFARPDIKTAPGAHVEPVRIGSEKGVLETTRDPATAEPAFKLIMREGVATELSAYQVRSMFGERVFEAATSQASNWLFKVLNITSWSALIWVTVGLLGQAAFTGRALIQWLVSEHKRTSVVPAAFWWLSLIGGLMLFAYFVWRQDLVGVLGQTTGIVIYARNLRLIAKNKRRAEREAAASA
ncbi:MAG: lipid-A-disaccharide synthase N-terminal domain-containing protein [Planctomycetota bacterium]|nr:lipid-A-disaccharide synthase N-terminal domain-containing protein [Planctomycetota bacterium]